MQTYPSIEHDVMALAREISYMLHETVPRRGAGKGGTPLVPGVVQIGSLESKGRHGENMANIHRLDSSIHASMKNMTTRVCMWIR